MDSDMISSSRYVHGTIKDQATGYKFPEFQIHRKDMRHASGHRVLMDFKKDNGQYKLSAKFANGIPITVASEGANWRPEKP